MSFSGQIDDPYSFLYPTFSFPPSKGCPTDSMTISLLTVAGGPSWTTQANFSSPLCWKLNFDSQRFANRWLTLLVYPGGEKLRSNSKTQKKPTSDYRDILFLDRLPSMTAVQNSDLAGKTLSATWNSPCLSRHDIYNSSPLTKIIWANQKNGAKLQTMRITTSSVRLWESSKNHGTGKTGKEPFRQNSTMLKQECEHTTAWSAPQVDWCKEMQKILLKRC